MNRDSIMATPAPQVQIVFWCNTCQHHVYGAKSGQRCPAGDPDCYSVLVGRRAILCPLESCQGEQVAVLVPSSKSAKDIWRVHLLEAHSSY